MATVYHYLHVAAENRAKEKEREMKAKLIKVREKLKEVQSTLDWMMANYDNVDGFPMAHADITRDNVDDSLAVVDELLAESDSEELEDAATDIVFDMWLNTSEADYSSRDVARAVIEIITRGRP